MRAASVVVCLLFAGLFSITQKKKETKPMVQSQDAVRFVKSESLPPSPGYSQAVEIRRGRIIYVAGQVALDQSGKVAEDTSARWSFALRS